MKQRLSFLFALVFCMLLSGCMVNDGQEEIDQLEDHISENWSNLYFYTYEQYDALIDNAKLPANFVYYEALKGFGRFQDFRLSPYTSEKPLEGGPVHFEYTFVDDADETYELNFSSTPPRLGQALTDTDIDLSDLRRAKADGFYEIHGVTYIYGSYGHLDYIVWQTNGFYCQVRMVYGSFEKYQYKQNTAIARLLDLENKSRADVLTNLAGKPCLRDVLAQAVYSVPFACFLWTITICTIIGIRKVRKRDAVCIHTDIA